MKHTTIDELLVLAKDALTPEAVAEVIRAAYDLGWQDGVKSTVDHVTIVLAKAQGVDVTLNSGGFAASMSLDPKE